MPDLIVSPAEVRKYSKDLREYANALDSQTGKALARLSHLGDTWRDKKYLSFKSEMDKVAKEVRKARALCEQYSKHLDAFANDVERAMSRRI